jgi:hypothetical protein
LYERSLGFSHRSPLETKNAEIEDRLPEAACRRLTMGVLRFAQPPVLVEEYTEVEGAF